MADRILPADHGSAPATHAYNVPGLSSLDFLRAVMEDEQLPMSYRIEAAKALLPFTTPYPRSQIIPPRCTVVIPPLEPRTPDPSAGDPTGNHSQNRVLPNTTLTRNDEAGDPVKLRGEPEPSTFIDYSQPHTPSELAEIKAAIDRLRPDLAHFPVPEFHLCPCGHWITGEYDCCRALSSRDPSKMN